MPNTEYKGQYPGALSRTDNETEICSDCGTNEALENTFGRGPIPQSEWDGEPILGLIHDKGAAVPIPKRVQEEGAEIAIAPGQDTSVPMKKNPNPPPRFIPV